MPSPNCGRVGGAAKALSGAMHEMTKHLIAGTAQARVEVTLPNDSEAKLCAALLKHASDVAMGDGAAIPKGLVETIDLRGCAVSITLREGGESI